MQLDRSQTYRDLEIWQLAQSLAVEVHKMTLDRLPRFEMYEIGSQIRRSAKSIPSNIVEGFGRKIYKNEYLKFLTYALASCNETIDHLEMLQKTDSLKDQTLYQHLHDQYDLLGRKINKFRQSVTKNYGKYQNQ